MRVPQEPPDDFVIVASVLSRDPARALAIARAVLPDDDYRPWRELRRRQPLPTIPGLASVGGPPLTLTHEEWWAVLRSTRRIRAQVIPTLTDTDGRPFSYVLTDSVLRQTDHVAAVLKGEIGVGSRIHDSTARDHHLVEQLEEEAITSSQLEGAVTTRRVAKEMLRLGRPPRDLSERMIANHYRALQFIRETSDRPLTPEVVLELHHLVTDGTLEDPLDAGRLQESGEARVGVYAEYDDVVLHQPPPAAQLPSRLEALCALANSRDDGPYLPGVLRALVVHFMTGYNHFFVDGNGRVARSLFYWTLLHEGYWLAEYVTISALLRRAPAQYGLSFLDVETDQGDLTYFFRHHLAVLDRAIKEFEAHVQRTSEELSVARRRLDPSAGEFNERQVALLSATSKDHTLTWTAQSVARQFAVTLPTAHRDLDDLVAGGWLVRHREGRRFIWRATEKLAELAE